jgi:hemoglobin-like flavoprotein
MKQLSIILLTAIIITSCRTQNPLKTGTLKTDFDKALADSVLAYALDHEALYSLADTIKPISSVKLLRFALAKDSTMKDGDAIITTEDSLLQIVEAHQKVCKALTKGDFEFILIPFNHTEKSMRNMEIYVVRKSRLASVLKTHTTFFGQWGFTPSTNPAVVLTAVEFETRLDRNRAYGYLFGYPSYAVDFFVESTKTQQTDPDKKLVPRDFFPIPVYAGNRGYFTYAMPKGYQPTATDSTILNKAIVTLDNYKLVREKFKSPTGLNATELWMHLNKNK